MNQEWAPCVVCGRPSKLHGEHHYREHDVSQGKGAGGTHDHLNTLEVCREHHEALHAKTLIVKIEDGIVRSFRDGELIGERPLKFNDDVASLMIPGDLPGSRKLMFAMSDDGLAYLWEQAEAGAAGAYLTQCAVSDAFHERYGGYGSRWYERCADIIGIAPATVYERWKAWAYVSGVAEPETELRRLGREAVQALGGRARKGEDVAALADEASAAIDNGMTRTALAKKLRAGDTAEPQCATTGECRCRWCGETWRSQ